MSSKAIELTDLKKCHPSRFEMVIKRGTWKDIQVSVFRASARRAASLIPNLPPHALFIYKHIVMIIKGYSCHI